MEGLNNTNEELEAREMVRFWLVVLLGMVMVLLGQLYLESRLWSLC